MTKRIAKNYIEKYFKKEKDLEKFYSHGLYCEKISKEIFKTLLGFDFFSEEEKHKYKNYEKLLFLASILHDIGIFVPGEKPHNKRGAKFILENEIQGLTEEENLIVANLVRFHRGKSPKNKNKMFGMLDEKLKSTVKLYAGILRVSDALDYNHYEICENISLSDDNKNKILYITLDLDMNNNVGFKLVFKKKSKLLRKILDRKIVLKSA